jgi:hypothetical protein
MSRFVSGEEGFEMLANHVVQHGALGLAADVRLLPGTAG